MGNGRQPSIKIDLPLNGDVLKQNIFGGFGADQQTQGQGPLAPQQQVAQLTPQQIDQPQGPQIAPSANLPEPSTAQAPVPQQPAQTENLRQDLMPKLGGAQGITQILQARLNDPRRQELEQRLKDANERGIQQREESIAGLQDILQKERERGGNKIGAISKALANFSDAFYGTNISKNIPEPETQAERSRRLSLLQRAISQEQGALSNQEINALKAQLGDADFKKLLQINEQSKARDRRFDDSLDFRKTLDFRRRKEKVFDRVEKAGLFDLNVTFQDLDKAIPNGINNFDESKDQIPGVGGLDGATPLAQLTDPKAREIRQLSRSLGNQVLKARSGAQINEQEAQRIFDELGFQQELLDDGTFRLTFKGIKGPREFIGGVRRAVKAVQKRENTLRSSFGNDAFDAVAPDFKLKLKPKRKSKPALKSQSKKLPTVQELESMTLEQLKQFNEGK